MQGKGGVGKTFAAVVLSQYLQSLGKEITCIDTDPVNQTFVGYEGLPVKELVLMSKDNQISSKNFDQLIEWITESPDEVVVDNGASSFVPLSNYLAKNKVLDFLKIQNIEVIIHTVIAGSQSLKDTLNGFMQLLDLFGSQVKFAVWINPLWGPVEHEGQTFEDMPIYKKYSQQIATLVYLPTYDADLFGADLSDLLRDKKTFDEGIKDPERFLMCRQRLTMIKRDMFNMLDNALGAL